MKAALGLARRGLGNVAPNPAVGCLIVKDRKVVGRGWTQPGGRPHAETVALTQAGANAKGAIAYVTLEPCAHHGKTPPCAEALIDAGIVKVISATSDPDSRVSGKGLALLRDAGIDVLENVMAEQAVLLNDGFFKSVTAARPHFTLKLAASLDGRIATKSGESKWITGSPARSYGHLLRASHDAILIGANTALLDDPSLTCRVEGLGNSSPHRLVLDSELRIEIGSKLVQTARSQPTTVICNKAAGKTEKRIGLQALGVSIVDVADTRDLAEVASVMAKLSITRVLVEGGGQLHASFLAAKMADELVCFTAGKAIGGDGLPAIAAFGLASLGGAPHFTLKSSRKIGADLLATYVNAE
ncbi:MAG: riboflavin biosynthesis protein RibD [Kordiimonadales bacterium]|nr:MAG: riboflavin biosynthesis protein RibD [Kordiimonadales bacterium]